METINPPTGTVAIMFTDIVDSTAITDYLVNMHGKEEGNKIYHENIRIHHDEIIRNSLKEHKGFEVKTIGDSFMASFHTAECAVQAAVAIQKTLIEKKISISSNSEKSPYLQIRIGLHLGASEYKEAENRPDYEGHDVNQAARIEGMAEAEQILISKSISETAGKIPNITYHSHGLRQLKGFKEKVEIIEVCWDGKKNSSSLSHSVKKVVSKRENIKKLKITKQFSLFLCDTDLLMKAHSQKEKIHLNDIFIYPELDKYNDIREFEKKESSEKLIANFCEYPKILIAGENQSGKTTLCKKIFMELRNKDYVPVYISDKNNQYKGKIENKILRAYKEQYEAISIEEIDKQRIVPIIDDFHSAKNKEKHIYDLSAYQHQIVIVDDIFSLNFKDENLIGAFTHFKIKEFLPSLRNQLIKKWTNLTDNKTVHDNEIYQNIDNTTELINTTLGKVIGNGIMPAYPFFILSVISTYDMFAKPLNQEITSQGYCYQALIYLYLRKQDVKNDEIEIYINFLTEFAFYFYSAEKNELSIDEFNSFMDSYLTKFNFPLKKKTLLFKLQQTQIIVLDNCNNYSFCYTYLYYFFVGKYLAENIEKNKIIIDSIVNNLHKDKNAYILIFLSHNSKDTYILDEIILNANSLFDKYNPATLSKKELSFFDKQVDIIVKEVLPPTKETPEKERIKRLKIQDIEEQVNKDNSIKIVREDDDVAIEFRRSIKTVEVMGRVLKNRAGSLEKSQLEFMFEEAMRVHLRILTSFFELIKYEKEQQEIVDFISGRLNKIIEDKAKKRKKEGKKEKKINEEELEKISKTIFWNINFFVIYSFIDKIVHSLGSNKLMKIIEKVCDKENTSASFLLKHGILMWYHKNLQVDNIAKRIAEDGFSDTAKKVIKFMIVNHCSIHSIGFKEKQKIEQKLGISVQKLLIQQAKRTQQK